MHPCTIYTECICVCGAVDPQNLYLISLPEGLNYSLEQIHHSCLHLLQIQTFKAKERACSGVLCPALQGYGVVEYTYRSLLLPPEHMCPCTKSPTECILHLHDPR